MEIQLFLGREGDGEEEPQKQNATLAHTNNLLLKGKDKTTNSETYNEKSHPLT